MNINHILVDMDPTIDQQPALARAITLAKEFNASIELLLVTYNNSLMTQWFLDDDKIEILKANYLKTQQRWLDSFVKDVVDAQIPVSVDVRWHKPLYEGIINKVKESKADLVIKSTHQHPAINKIFFSPNDWQLLKACPVPLLLAKEETATEYNNIMAAVDPTQSHGKPEGMDKVILDYSVELSEKLAVTAHVSHCYEPIELQMWPNVGANSPGLGLGLPFNGHVGYLEELQRRQTEQFDDILANYSFDTDNRHLESGNPSQVLPELIDRYDIDLLIIGTTYRTGLLGSTAEKILDNVNCDVLALKPQGFETL